MRWLDRAAASVAGTTDPPAPISWYSPSFFRMNIGMVYHALGEHRDAAAPTAAGLEGLPAEQRDADWTGEYRDAMHEARARAWMQAWPDGVAGMEDAARTRCADLRLPTDTAAWSVRHVAASSSIRSARNSRVRGSHG